MTTDQDLAIDEEEFHSSFRVFLHAVEMLAAAPEEQCRMMGNFNVAWELKEDVKAGKFLAGQGYLTPLEEAWVQSLVAALDPINTQVLPSSTDAKANLEAMSHPAWQPVRYLAAEVLLQLSTSAASNATYLRLPKSAA